MRLAAVRVVGFVVVCLVASCGGPTPSGPSPGVVPNPLPQVTSAAPALTGVVLENGGRLTVRGRIEYLYGPASDAFGGLVPVSPIDGRYIIQSIPSGTRVNLLFLPNSGVASGTLHQPCAAYTTVSEATTLNVELISKGSPPSNPSPTLSGVVFRRDQDVRIPLSVTLMYSGAAATRADESGRYSLCRLPAGPGVLLVGATCNDQWMYVPVVINGDTVVDVDMTEWFRSCPGLVDI
jgi:hypothetical protein